MFTEDVLSIFRLLTSSCLYANVTDGTFVTD